MLTRTRSARLPDAMLPRSVRPTAVAGLRANRADRMRQVVADILRGQCEGALQQADRHIVRGNDVEQTAPCEGGRADIAGVRAAADDVRRAHQDR